MSNRYVERSTVFSFRDIHLQMSKLNERLDKLKLTYKNVHQFLKTETTLQCTKINK